MIQFTPEVRQALHEGAAVVALESTIIAHGMPYPQNVETARAVEERVRRVGAVPATVAIIGGMLKAGLSSDELIYLSQKGQAVDKCSRRDLPILLSQKKDGATTVAATMIAAQMAGIAVFATGGIGGVHRRASETMDISADLQELARTSVAVVCAGAKAILDLPLSLEYLETHGVPVIGYQTDRFPAFYTRDSGLGVDVRMDDPEAVAHFLHTKWSMGLGGGAVIANPIPAASALNEDVINAAIEKALDDVKEEGIQGKKITPFLLARVEKLTSGHSLKSNIDLVLHNASIGAQIAMAYALLKRSNSRS